MAIKVSTTGQTTFVKQIKVGTPIKRVAAAPVSGGGGSGIDSSATVNLIDSAYVQARQITYNVLDSADVLAISTADLSSDSDVIAVVTRQIVDSAYVQARVTFPTDEVGLDSTAVIALITENDQQRDSAFVTEIIDSDYINDRVVAAASGIDSDATLALIDSTYVQARQTPQDFAYSSLTGTPNVLDSSDVAEIAGSIEGLDSTGVSNLIDSDYINARVDTVEASGVDSDAVIGLIDSAYIQSRVTFPEDEVGIDSAAVIGLIDSAYVQARAENYLISANEENQIIPDNENVELGSLENPFKRIYLDSNSVYIGGLVLSDSSGQFIVRDLDGNTVSLVPGVEIGTVDSADVLTLVDSTYIKSQVTIPTELAAFQDASLNGSPVAYINRDAFVNGDLLPLGNHNLGSSSYRWNTIYLKGRTIDLGGLLISTESDGSGGDLQLGFSFGGNAPQTLSEVAASGMRLDQLSDVDSNPYAGAIIVYNGDSWQYAYHIDSTDILALIDQSYIRNNQIQYSTADFTDSAFVTGLPVSTFENDANYLDSITVTGVIDQTYVRDNQITYSNVSEFTNDANYTTYDSTNTIGLVDSAYVRARVQTDQDLRTTDNVTFSGVTISGDLTVSGTTTTLNSVTYTVTDPLLHLADSNEFSDVVDIGFVGHYSPDGGITKEHTGFFRDATNAQYYIFNGLQDSAFDSSLPTNIVNRNGTGFELATLNVGTIKGKYAGFDSDFNTKSVSDLPNDANYLDSTTVQSVIDASYIQSNQTAYSNVSEFVNDANYLDSTTVQNVINATYIQANQTTYDFLDSAEAIALIDSDYVRARQITYDFLDSAETITLIDSDYVQARQITYTVYTDSDTRALIDSDYVQARQITYDVLDSSDIVDTILTKSTIENKIFTLNTSPQAYVNNFGSGDPYNYTWPNSISFANGYWFDFETGNRYKKLSGTWSLIDSGVNSASTISIVEETVDSAYVNARIGQAIDSASTINIITETVDSAYIDDLSPAFIYRRFQFTASNGQTVFTGNDDNGLNLDYKASHSAVFLNGILIQSTNDYETTDSSTITLISGADSNDVLTVETMFGRTHLVDVDSAQTYAMINARVDSAYVQSLQADIAAAAITKFNYRAIQDQTVFSGTDIGGQSLTFTDSDAVQIFYNGTLVIDDGDFDPDPDAGTVTLNKGVDSGDIVSVMVFSSKKVVVELGFKDITSNGNDINHFTSFSAANNADTLNFGVTGHNFSVSTDPNTNSVIYNANILDSYEILQLTTQQFNGDSSVVGFVVREIVDSNYIQGKEDAIYAAPAFESTIKGIIDSDYIGKRSTDSNEVAHIIRQDVTSDFLNGRLDSDYIRTNIADSAFVKGFIDANYIRTFGADSDYVKTIATLDYVRGLADSGYIKSVADADYIKGLADSDYVNGIVDFRVDSDFIDNLIGYKYLDSAEVSALVDSDYVQTRRPFDGVFSVVNNGASAYLFTGDGFITSQNNPTLYLQRGQKYKFIVNAPSHPFRIETDAGVAYNTGVTNNAADQGDIIFEVPWYAPSSLKYRCTVHSNMVGTIEVLTQPWLDSDDVISLVDSDYVELRQVKYTNVSEFVNDANYLDSTTVTGVIDGTYVNDLVDTTQFLDSNQVINLIDSDYVNSRVLDPSFNIDVYADSNDLTADELLQDSANTISMKGGTGITLTTQNNEVKISQTSYSYVMATLFG